MNAWSFHSRWKWWTATAHARNRWQAIISGWGWLISFKQTFRSCPFTITYWGRFEQLCFYRKFFLILRRLKFQNLIKRFWIKLRRVYISKIKIKLRVWIWWGCTILTTPFFQAGSVVDCDSLTFIRLRSHKEKS